MLIKWGVFVFVFVCVCVCVIPKKLLFGWLPERRPAHGTKMRWRDRVRKGGMQQHRIGGAGGGSVGLDWRMPQREGCMEEDEQRRARKAADHAGVGATAMPFKCDTCQRTFRRRQDISRHRCVTTRPKGQVVTRPPS